LRLGNLDGFRLRNRRRQIKPQVRNGIEWMTNETWTIERLIDQAVKSNGVHG